MRENRFFLVLMSCFYLSMTGPLTSNAQTTHLPKVVTEGDSSSDGLHIIGVDGNNYQNLRRATWGNR